VPLGRFLCTGSLRVDEAQNGHPISGLLVGEKSVSSSNKYLYRTPSVILVLQIHTACFCSCGPGKRTSKELEDVQNIAPSVVLVAARTSGQTLVKRVTRPFCGTEGLFETFSCMALCTLLL
jgi:hypothetical protein